MTFKLRSKTEEIVKSGWKSNQTVGTAYAQAKSWERTWLGRVSWRGAGEAAQQTRGYLLQRSRQETPVIRFGWWQQRFRAVVRVEMYVGDEIDIACWCIGHERLRNRASPCFLV